MEIGKVCLVTFSPTHTSYRIGEAIAHGIKGGEFLIVDLTLHGIEQIKFSEDTIVVITVPVYGGHVSPLALKRMEALEAISSPTVIAVVYGNRAYEDALLELNDTVSARGAVPVASAAIVAQHSMLPTVAANRPTDTDYQNLSVFARFAMKKFDDVHPVPVKVPGTRPYRDWSKMPFTPVVSNSCVHCGMCIQQCPTKAISATDPKITDLTKCILCMRCVALCPQRARSLPPPAQEAIEKKLAPVANLRRENEFFF